MGRRKFVLPLSEKERWVLRPVIFDDFLVGLVSGFVEVA